MNCRQCEHFDEGKFCAGDLRRWPCGKGVASLPDGYFIQAQGKYGVVNVEYSQPLQKLPWLIEEHDCPEFEEDK